MAKHLKWILPTTLVLALLGFVGYRVYLMAMNTPMPREAKLIDCTGAVVTCSFTPRKAHGFEMIMATSDLTGFTGQVQISKGSREIGAFEIDSVRTQPCNWLQPLGIPEAFILTGHVHTNSSGLQRYLTAGEEHQIRFTFSRTPATNASIWMTWIERYQDFKAK